MNQPSINSLGESGFFLQRFLEALAAGRWYAVLPVFGVFATLYLTTWVDNVGDTDDVYFFSYWVENFAMTFVGDPRLMAYKSLMQALYHGFAGIGIPIGGLELLRGFSALCGGLVVVVFYRLLACDLKVHVYAAATGALLLASSYGFWRYAIEAEVYVPAILLLLIALRWFYRLDEKDAFTPLQVLPLGVFCGLAVLFYQPNAIPLGFAFTLLMLRQGRCCGLMVYALVGAAVVLGGYYLGFRIFQTHPQGMESFLAYVQSRSEEFRLWEFNLQNAQYAALGSLAIITHDLVSANWLFAHQWLGQAVHELFAYNWLIEKRYAAEYAGWLAYLPLFVLPVLLLLVGRIVWRAFPFGFAALRSPRVVLLLVWLLVNGLVVWRLNPHGPEAWIMLLPPLLIVLTLLFVEPAVQRGVRHALLAMLLLLAAHNAFSGIAIIHDRLSEYAVAKMQWILDNAGPNDAVLIVDDNPLFMTMNYRSNATILPLVLEATPIISEGLLTGHWRVRLGSELSRDLRVVMLDEHFAATLARGHRIIFTSDFFEGSRRRDISGLSESDRQWLERLRSQLTVVWSDEQLGTVYVLDKPLSPRF